MVERVRDVEQQRRRAVNRGDVTGHRVVQPARRCSSSQQRLRYLDASRRARRERVAPRPGQAHAGVLGIARDQRLDAREVDRAAGERVGIDDEERLPDPRPVALVDEERCPPRSRTPRL